MRILSKVPAAIAAVALGLTGAVIVSTVAQAAQSTVNLLTASPFAILSGTPGITDAGHASVITGNVGLSPASGAAIGLNCTQVTGTIYSVDAGGPLPCRVTNGPLMVSAKNDLDAAFIDAAGRTPVTTVPTELGGTTKTPGVYADNLATTFGITAGAGPLVLDGQGNPAAVFIFEMNSGSTGLTVGPGSLVNLINGASACNVFWRVDTATIDTTADFKGNILALNSITVNNGAKVTGRLLARNGDVTLNTDTITAPNCAAAGSLTAGTTLPNTGVGTKTKTPWGIIIGSSLLVALMSAALVWRKSVI